MDPLRSWREALRMPAAVLLAFFILVAVPFSVSASFGDGTPTIRLPSPFSGQSVSLKIEGSTGAFTQEIPIKIPPGRSAIEPSLTLQYNSQRTEDGIFGYGWAITIPSIQRLNKTGSQDLYSTTSPAFTSSMDGELIQVATTSVTHKARIDTGASLSYTYTDNTWTVYDKKGTRYLFGSTDAGRQYDTATTSVRTYTWMLQEIRDKNENYVSFTYGHDQNEIYPKTIVYTGNGSTDGPFTISFATTTRPDIRETFRPGFKVTTGSRISEIDISVAGEVVGKYTLSYGTGVNGTRSLLTSVQQFGYDEDDVETSLPAIAFGYASSSTMFIAKSSGGLQLAGQSYIPADVNGNGINDVSNFYRTVDDIPPLSLGEWYLDQGGPSKIYGESVHEYWSNRNSSFVLTPSLRGVRYIDANGDGKVDILKSIRNDQAGTYTRENYVNVYDGSSFGWSPTTTFTGILPAFDFVSSGGSAMVTGIFGEVNGDGLTDYVMALQDHTGNYTYLGNQSAFATSTSFAPLYQMPSLASTSTDGSQIIDINGDGLGDWVYSTLNDTQVRLNNGSGWEGVSTQWTLATSTIYKSTAGGSTEYFDRGMRFQDVNGDGLVDFIRGYDVTPHGSCSAFPSPEFASIRYVILNTGNGWTTSNLYSIGNVLSGQTSRCGPLGLNHDEYANWLGNGQMPQDVITKVTYPQGGHKNIVYTPSAQLGTNPDLPLSLLVVTETGEYDGFGTISTSTYAYAGGRVYTSGGASDRKFAGFFTATTTASDVVTATYFHQGNTTATTSGEQNDGFSLMHRIFRTDVFDLVGNIQERTLNRWDATTTASVGTMQLGLGSELTMRYGTDGTRRDSVIEYRYATTTNDLIRKTEYGEVAGSLLGTFSDIGLDKRVTDILYTASSTATSTPVSNANAASLDLEKDSTQYASRADNSSLSIAGSISTEAWIKLESVPADGLSYGILTKWDNGTSNRSYNFSVVTTGGGSPFARLQFTMSSDGGGANIRYKTSNNTNLIDYIGQWVHVAATYSSGNGITLYVNGSDDGSNDAAGSITSVYDGNAAFALGVANLGGTPNSYFDGVIDDARVWSVERTSGQVSSTRSQELVGDESNLVGYWKLNNSPNDGTSNSNDLTLSGSPSYTSDVPFTGATSGGGFSSSFTAAIDLPYQETLYDQNGGRVRETRFYYDGQPLASTTKGNLTKRETWISGSTYASEQYAYNDFGMVASTTDPRGGVTEYVYEPRNLYVATSTNALGHDTEFYYDYTLGKPKETIDPNGLRFQTAYDGLDRPIAEKQPDLSSPGSLVNRKTYAYTDTVGSRKVVETNYLDGSTDFTLYKYLDGLDRVIQTRKEAEESDTYSTQDFTYNNVGLLSRESLPYFSTGTSKTTATTTENLFTRYTYDALKRPLTVANALGTTTTAYAAWSATTTDANGNPKGFAYDAYQRLAGVTEYGGGSTYYSTRYTYDGAGNLASTTDAAGNIRNFTYDGRGKRLTAEDLHDLVDATYGTWTYVYDAAGNVATTTDPKAQTVEYLYDVLNRPLSENYTGSGGLEVEYAYDTCTYGIGRLCTATSTSAVIAFAYNALGQVGSETKTIDGASYNTSYTYNRQGGMTGVVYHDSSEVSYAYNTAGLLESVSQKESGGAFTPIVSDFDYGPHEKETYKLFENGVSSTYTYGANELYRLKNIYTASSTLSFGGGGNFAFRDDWGSTFARVADALPFALKKMRNLFAQALDDEVQSDATFTEPEEVATTTPSEEVIFEPTIDAPEEVSEVAATSTPEVPEEEVAEPADVDEEPVVVDETVVVASSIDLTKDSELAAAIEIVSEVRLETTFSTSTEGEAVPSTKEITLYKATLGAEGLVLRSDRPEIQLTKWGRTALTIGYPLVTTEDAALSGKTLTWSDTSGQSVEAYTLPAQPGMEGGGVEFQLVLAEKPSTNVFEFSVVHADSFDFFYQAPLNEEVQDEGVVCTETQCLDAGGAVVAERPEHVVGSYAVYHRHLRGQEDDGTDYATGKAFHIFRPQIIDADGKSVWGSLEYQKGVLRVTAPQEFLDTATYPVKVDPTFGYTVAGASNAAMNQDGAALAQYVLRDANASISKLTMYEKVGSTGTRSIKGLIYSDSSEYPGTLLGSTTPRSVSNTNAGWQDLVFPEPVSIATAGQYWLGFVGDSGSPTQHYYYDTGVVNQFYARNASSGDYASPPTSYPGGATAASRIVSIYATYTSGAAYGSNTHSLELEKDSSQYAYRSDSAPLSITGSISTEAWIKLESVPADGLSSSILAKWDNGSGNRSYNFAVETTGGGSPFTRLKLTLSSDGGGANIQYKTSNDTDLADFIGDWVHVAATWSSAAGIKLYVNGVDDGSNDAGGSVGSIYDSNASAAVGAGNLGGTSHSYFDGKIDDLRLWSTARSGGDISGAYEEELAGNETNLVGYWKFNNNENDTTANALNLTLTNSPTFSSDVGFPGESATSTEQGAHDGIQNITLTYDAVGNILNVLDTSATVNARNVEYLYDSLYRLTSAATTWASSTPYSDTYTYDALGNILSKTGQGTYTYGETGYTNPHAPTLIGSLGLSYDNNGNLTSFASTTNAWDYKNRLIASYASSSPTTTYGYDHTANRTFKAFQSATTTFSSKYFNREIANFATSTATTTKHIFTPGGDLLATVIGSGTGYASTTKQYLHTDWLGSVNVITNASGTIARAQDYYPFGGDRINSGPAQEQRGYIGGEKDLQTNNQYLINRYLSNERGQFLSQDPVFWELNQTSDGKKALLDPQLQNSAQTMGGLNSGFASDWSQNMQSRGNSISQIKYLADPQLQNSYSYARNNPLIYSDPNGELPFLVPILIAYGAASMAIDAWDAYNMNIKYADVTTPQQKFSSGAKFGVGAFLNLTGLAATRVGLAGYDTAISGLSATLDALDHYFAPQIYQKTNYNQIQSQPSIQGRQEFVQSYNSSMGYSTGGGGSMPSNNSLWTTPSGAVVTWGGSLVSGPPKK